MENWLYTTRKHQLTTSLGAKINSFKVTTLNTEGMSDEKAELLSKLQPESSAYKRLTESPLFQTSQVCTL